jgi:hypothetical protein
MDQFYGRNKKRPETRVEGNMQDRYEELKVAAEKAEKRS